MNSSRPKVEKYKSHEDWIDNVKVFACVFVVIGHFFQSMAKSGIIPAGNIYSWFEAAIYDFHVQLFFICSGYLYQKYSHINSLKEWENNIKKKFISLGVPYFVFTSITIGMKNLFESSINTSESGYFFTLFLNPTAPYWYLYVLFFIFLIMPVIRSERGMYILISVALICKVTDIFNIVYYSAPYAVNGVLDNVIWFVVGMGIAYSCFYVKFKRSTSLLCGGVFIILSIITVNFNILIIGQKFVLGCIACFSILGVIYTTYNRKIENKVYSALREYTLPIFLMHTFFAAGLRVLLLKLGILNVFIHVISGIIISFSGPILVAVFMKKTRYLEVLIYPAKFIKL